MDNYRKYPIYDTVKPFFFFLIKDRSPCFGYIPMNLKRRGGGGYFGDFKIAMYTGTKNSEKSVLYVTFFLK
jgi:hypothetical protein